MDIFYNSSWSNINQIRIRFVMNLNITASNIVLEFSSCTYSMHANIPFKDIPLRELSLHGEFNFVLVAELCNFHLGHFISSTI